jgi:hypothetical protein
MAAARRKILSLSLVLLTALAVTGAAGASVRPQTPSTGVSSGMTVEADCCSGSWTPGACPGNTIWG